MKISGVVKQKNFSSDRAFWSHWAQLPHFIDVETEAPCATCLRDGVVLETNSVESKRFYRMCYGTYCRLSPNALVLDLSLNRTVLALLMDRFSCSWPWLGATAFLLDVSGAPDTADREVWEPAGLTGSFFIVSILLSWKVTGGGIG